jgi:hypothetical protein
MVNYFGLIHHVLLKAMQHRAFQVCDTSFSTLFPLSICLCYLLGEGSTTNSDFSDSTNHSPVDVDLSNITLPKLTLILPSLCDNCTQNSHIKNMSQHQTKCEIPNILTFLGEQRLSLLC